MGWVLAGIGLIALGVILLIDRMGHWDAGDVVSDWWPTIIIAIGLAQLTALPRPWLGSMIVVGAGAVLLVHQLGMLPDNTWDYLWPSLIIAAGVWMLVAYLRRKRGTTTSADEVTILSIFGGTKTASNARAFSGGSVTAIFGESEIDLRDAGLADDGAYINATAIFGDSTVIVPENWVVEMSSIPILGDVTYETADREVTADAPRLTVRGLAVFGDVKVVHRR